MTATNKAIIRRKALSKGCLKSEVKVSFGENVLDNTYLTFIAIPDGEKIDIIRVAIEEEQRDPAVAAVNRHDEQDAHDPTLLRRVRVPA